MVIAFILSMQFHGSARNPPGKCHAIVKPVGKAKAAVERAAALIARKSFTYEFGDGWSALVSVRRVDYHESQMIRRQTLGFRGYDWMVKSIWETGEIKPKEERAKIQPHPGAQAEFLERNSEQGRIFKGRG